MRLTATILFHCLVHCLVQCTAMVAAPSEETAAAGVAEQVRNARTRPVNGVRGGGAPLAAENSIRVVCTINGSKAGLYSLMAALAGQQD